MSKVKCLALLIALMIGFGALVAQAPAWAWAHNAGGTDNDVAKAIAIDSQGNQYVTGVYQGTASFGSTTLTSSGYYEGNVFVAKLDSGGNFLWATKAGGVSVYDRGMGIAVDAAGFVYLIGQFGETASFGTHSLTAGYGTEIFVAKLDAAGNWLWAVKADGDYDGHGTGIAVDPAGYAYVTGYFYGSASFGSHNLASYGYDNDIFAAQLDSAGNWLWAVRAGGIEDDYGRGIAVDAAGSAYLTGYFEETADFGSHTIVSSGESDIFAAKLDSAGNWLWATKAGGPDLAYGWSITVDSAGSAYMAGSFTGTVSFGTHNLTSSGSEDIFAAKLDSTGNFLWAASAGGEYYDVCSAIAVDSGGSAYLTGYFTEAASFGSHSLIAADYADVFVTKLNSAGNFLWAISAGGIGADWGYGVATDSAGSAYIAGYFSFSHSIFGQFDLITQGQQDVFVAKLGFGTPVDEDLAPEANSSCLYGAWPNPLRPGETAMVKTTVAPGETGYLTFFNLRGQTIARHSLIPGTQQTSFSSSGLPSGVYFYQFQAGNYQEVKKLILLK